MAAAKGLQRLVWFRRGCLVVGWAGFLAAVALRRSGGPIGLLAGAGLAAFGLALASGFRLRALAKRALPRRDAADRDAADPGAARSTEPGDEAFRAGHEQRVARLLEERPEDGDLRRVAIGGGRKWAVWRGGSPEERAKLSWAPGELEWGAAYLEALNRVKAGPDEEVQAIRAVVGTRPDDGSCVELAVLRFDGSPPRAVRLDPARLAQAFRQARAAKAGEPRLWLTFGEVKDGR